MGFSLCPICRARHYASYSDMYLDGRYSQNLSSLFLKALMVGARTTSSGRLFQSSNILSEKKLFLTLQLLPLPCWCLLSFRLFFNSSTLAVIHPCHHFVPGRSETPLIVYSAKSDAPSLTLTCMLVPISSSGKFNCVHV